MSRLQQFLYGCRDSIPMIVGILPFGLIYGALASLAGLSLGQALGMSLLVYAGSAQFIAISLLTLGSGAVVILLTTLVVNLRHVLYSAALQPYVGRLPQRWRVPVGAGLRYAGDLYRYCGAGAAQSTTDCCSSGSRCGGAAVPRLAVQAWADGGCTQRYYGRRTAGALQNGRDCRGGRVMAIWLLILGMALITFAIRYSLFAFPDLRFPPLVRQGLHYVPTAVLSAIVLPGMLIPDGQQWAFSLDNAYLLAGLATIAIAALTRHLLATIGGGLLVFFMVRWLLGQLPL